MELEGAVFMGDEIVAGSKGLAQIRFIDDTRLVIGPNSRLKIDTFVFNPDNTAQRVTINALKGTFRFISGRSPPSAYSIRTPTSTIGIRG
ncbi:MAG TPA: FecR domain-containing protein [Propylenella sp.]